MICKAAMLCVELDLSCASEGFVLIRNREGRVGDVARAIKTSVGEGRIDRKTFSRIAEPGRLESLGCPLLMARLYGYMGYYEILVRRLSTGALGSIPVRTADDVRTVFSVQRWQLGGWRPLDGWNPFICAP